MVLLDLVRYYKEFQELDYTLLAVTILIGNDVDWDRNVSEEYFIHTMPNIRQIHTEESESDTPSILRSNIKSVDPKLLKHYFESKLKYTKFIQTTKHPISG